MHVLKSQKHIIKAIINDFNKFAKNLYVVFVASHKHEHLKGRIGQIGLALAEGVCVMLPNQSSSGFSSAPPGSRAITCRPLPATPWPL